MSEPLYDAGDSKPSGLLDKLTREGAIVPNEAESRKIRARYYTATYYQHEASRTLIPKPDFTLTEEELMILWNIDGLTGEVGELMNRIKKAIWHRHGMDEQFKKEVKEELGDIAWYFAALCTKLGFEMGEVLLDNTDKLKKRFPNGYEQTKTVTGNRADKPQEVPQEALEHATKLREEGHEQEAKLFLKPFTQARSELELEFLNRTFSTDIDWVVKAGNDGKYYAKQANNPDSEEIPLTIDQMQYIMSLQERKTLDLSNLPPGDYHIPSEVAFIEKYDNLINTGKYMDAAALVLAREGKNIFGERLSEQERNEILGITYTSGQDVPDFKPSGRTK